LSVSLGFRVKNIKKDFKKTLKSILKSSLKNPKKKIKGFYISYMKTKK